MNKRKLTGRPITIMITNNKGGVGKTSETIEIAHILAQKYKVLVIDCDPQSNLSLYAEADFSKKNLRNLLDVAFDDVSECIQTIGSYDLIAGSRDLVNAPKLYTDSDDEYLLQELCRNSLDYDFILLDSAPAQSLISIMELTAADYVIAVTECDDGSILGVRNVKSDIKTITKRRNPDLKYLGVIFNKYENTNAHKLAIENLKEIAEEIGCEPFKTAIRKSSKSSESKTFREPVSVYEKRNNIAIDNEALVKEILKRIKADRGE